MADDYAFTAERLLDAAGLVRGSNASYLIEAGRQGHFSEWARDWIPKNWPAFMGDGGAYREAVLSGCVMKAVILFIRYEEATARHALSTYKNSTRRG